MSDLQPAAAPAPGVPAGAPAGGAPAGDVIHDIGFRHYDGPRYGRGWIVRSLLVDTVRGVFGLGRPARSKVMPWALVAILAVPPIIIGLIVLLVGGDDPPITYTQFLYQFNVPISLFVAGAAPYAVSRDLRHGVLPLYLSRPLVRTDYVAARYGGLVLAVFAILAVPQTLLLIAALLAKLDVGAQLVGWAGGLAMSALLALLLSAVGLAIAAFTPRRGLGVAAIITVLIVVQGFSFALSGLAYGQDAEGLAVLAGALDPYRLIDGLAVWLLGADPVIPDFAPTDAGQGAVFVLVYVVALAAFGGLLLQRYRKAGRL
jgi:ABC-2 type transport system permease protein